MGEVTEVTDVVTRDGLELTAETVSGWWPEQASDQLVARTTAIVA
jgi:hypothetical protein